MSDNTAMHREAFFLLCGKEIGSGIARTVYDCNVMKDVVIKVEEHSRSFQNVLEWETWQRVQGTDMEKWFAPCLNISASGGVLLQRRTTPPAKYPDKMPAFLTDFKRTNYGLYKGRVVAHDYGMTLLMENGMTKRMLKANWWDA